MKFAALIFAALSLSGLSVLERATAFAEDAPVRPAGIEADGGHGPEGETGAEEYDVAGDLDDTKRRARSLFFLGMNKMNHNLPGYGAKMLEESLELNPGHYRTYLMLAKAYTRLERYDDALDVLHRAAGLEPANPVAYDLAMQLYLYQGNPEKSLETAEAAMEAGVDGQALPDLGWTYYLVGRPDDARAFFNRNIEMYGDSYGPLRNLGILSFVRGDYVEALAYFNKAGEMDPENNAVLYLNAISYNRLGDKAKVFDEIRAMKSRDSNYRQSIARYEKLYFPNTDPGNLKNYIYMLREGVPGSAEAEDEQ